MAFLLAGITAEDDLNSYEAWISRTLTANSPRTLSFGIVSAPGWPPCDPFEQELNLPA
jgi:hypothetical protein